MALTPLLLCQSHGSSAPSSPIPPYKRSSSDDKINTLGKGHLSQVNVKNAALLEKKLIALQQTTEKNEYQTRLLNGICDFLQTTDLNQFPQHRRKLMNLVSSEFRENFRSRLVDRANTLEETNRFISQEVKNATKILNQLKQLRAQLDTKLSQLEETLRMINETFSEIQSSPIESSRSSHRMNQGLDKLSPRDTD